MLACKFALQGDRADRQKGDMQHAGMRGASGTLCLGVGVQHSL